MTKKPKVILVDDHKIFRDALKSLLVNEDVADVVAEASNGAEFLDILETRVPDLVLMDINMPTMNGIEATKKSIDKIPGLKILVLSMHGDEIFYTKMIHAGAKGFVLKTSGINELESAMHELLKGESYFSSELLRKIISTIGSTKIVKSLNSNSENLLSKREHEVLQQICNGYNNNEISDILHISPKTVKGHRTNLLAKTGCKNTASLIIYSVKNKLIEI